MGTFDFEEYSENYRRRFYHGQQTGLLKLAPMYLPESYSVKVLGLKDSEGNDLVLYQTDYLKLCKKIKNMPEVGTIEAFQQLSKEAKLHILQEEKLSVIRYFSPTNLANHELDIASSDFSEGRIVTREGKVIPKDAEQICIVIHDDKIFIHPKIRAKVGAINEASGQHDGKQHLGVVGVNHSSLSECGPVQVAASMVHDAQHGWVIDNRSGHYGTRPHQMRYLLEALERAGVPLENFSVKVYVSKTGKHVLGYFAKDYETTDYENAKTFLERVRRSHASIDLAFERSLNSPTTTEASEYSASTQSFKSLSLDQEGSLKDGLPKEDEGSLDDHDDVKFSSSSRRR